jgi:hypothetical protein
MLLEILIKNLESQFPSLNFVVDEENYLVIIPSLHEEIGNIEIQDDYSQFTIFIGDFTHLHVGHYNETLSDHERAVVMAEEVIDFLHSMFNDEIVMWRSHQGGGFTYRDNLESAASHIGKHQKWLWSGLLSE